VWAFERSSTGWLPIGEGKITLSGVTGTSYFGRGIALSPDASTAIIGAPGEGEYRGAVWVFTRSPSGFALQAEATAAEEQGAARFGFAVAASDGAETVLVGGPHDDGGLGAAWVFERSGNSLVQREPKLVGEGEAGDGRFGRALAIAASGTAALIAAPHDGSDRGAAWQFLRSASGWSAEKFSADESRGQFGASIALSADGAIPLFGEPWSANKAGVAWAGLPPANVTAVDPSRGPAGGGTSVTITGAGFTEVSGVRFGTRSAHYEVRSSSSIVAVSPPGAAGSTVDVTVATAHGTSAATVADHYAYLGSEAEAGEAEEASSEEESSEEGVGTLGLAASRGPGCRFALLSNKIAVLAGGRAGLRLRRLGPGRCAGKLTLSVRVKGKHGKPQARSIGGTRFAISKSTPVTVRVRLNPFGLALLRSGHGQARATLVVVRLAPLPARAQSASVQLRLGR
jgi:hypothetical protein